jgi:hypothetical protein
MEGTGMKLKKAMLVNLLLCLVCTGVFTPAHLWAKEANDPVIKVLNPLGDPPPIKMTPLSKRLDTIKGKTIYVVDDGYPGSDILLAELISVMQEKYPDTKFIYKKETRPIDSLWDEIREKGDAMIIALGH